MHKSLVPLCCRLMDHMQQKPFRADPAASKEQPSPGLPPQLTVQEPPHISPAGGLKTESNLTQAAVTRLDMTDRLQSHQPKSGFTPSTLASIRRPRPTAFGNKLPLKTTRISVDPSKDTHPIPVCIPGPQSVTSLPHSQTAPSFPLSSPQSPLSPQTSSGQPYLSPSSSLRLKPSSSPQPQKTTSPGSSTQGQSENPGESNEFR